MLLFWCDALNIQCKYLFNNSQNTSLKHWSVRITNLEMDKLDTSEMTDVNSHTEWGATWRIKQWISKKTLKDFMRPITMGQYSFHSNHKGTLTVEMHILFFPYILSIKLHLTLSWPKKKKKGLVTFADP